MNTPQSVVTCVYCGHEYPDGTPTAKHDLLTSHIKICDKHPMREAEIRIKKLYKALIGLVGVETKIELETMYEVIKILPTIEDDKNVMLTAVNTLLEEISYINT